jgi:hypothetical protein
VRGTDVTSPKLLPRRRILSSKPRQQNKKPARSPLLGEENDRRLWYFGMTGF